MQDADGSLSLVLWKREDVDVTPDYVKANAPRNSRGEYGTVHGVKGLFRGLGQDLSGGNQGALV